jgi:hypothetical protein
MEVYRPSERRDREISAGQLFRVLVSRVLPGEMQVDAALDSGSTLDLLEEREQ